MTLQVPFDEFARAAERMAGTKEAYLAPKGTGSHVTAGAPEKNTIVVTETDLGVEAAKEELRKRGMITHNGAWSQDGIVDEFEAEPDLHVAAVAYASSEAKPGVWVDAYASLPTQVQVLRAMFDEFRTTGEVDDVAFEEFVRLANPVVVILGPAQLRAFAKQKEEC